MPSARWARQEFPVQRMRIANQEKISLKKRMEEIGKPKLIGTHYNENGLTAVQPFRFLTDDRPERIKDQ